MLVLRVAWRNVWRNRRRTGIVVTAVAVGIAGVILSMALNFGMVAQMVQTAIATELGHVQVHARGYEESPELEVRLRDGGEAAEEVLEGRADVRAWAARVKAEGLLQSPRASAGVRVLGVDPGREAHVSSVADSIVAGTYFDGARRVVLGEALARRLHVGVGDKVVLSVQDLPGDLTGEAFRVSGIFRTASLGLDRSTLFLRLDEAQSLYGLDGSVSEVVAVAKDRAAIPDVEHALEGALGDRAEVRTWGQLEPMLVYLVDMFDAMAWYVYGAVFVAMGFGIANVLLMSVHERTREIGVLMALGMRRGRVVGMVLVESLCMTGVGLVAGYALAVASVAAFGDGIDLGDYAQGLAEFGVGARIVPVLRAADLGIPLAVAVACAFVASLWPAWRAARLRPAEAVRKL